MGHIPVMLDHVIEHLAPKDGEVFLDGTFGGGGYSRRILEAADCCVIGVDRDPHAQVRSAALTADYPDRFRFVDGRFGDLDEIAINCGPGQLDGVVVDLGVSSFQLDEAERGFSFMRDGPLDMRMSQAGPSAAELVNTAPEAVLANIIFQLGEERDSRRIARRIVEVRKSTPFSTTLQLAETVEQAVGGRRGKKTHPATKTFQALRMFINEELDELNCALESAEAALKPGGRLVVVTFHSLEDRMVKIFMAERSGKNEGGSRFMPVASTAGPQPTFTSVRKVSAPDTAEIEANARARSSRLRSAIRTDAPAWDSETELSVDLPMLSEVCR